MRISNKCNVENVEVGVVLVSREGNRMRHG